MKIDFHTHCFPDKLAARAIKELADRSLLPPHFDGTLSGLKARINQAGVGAAVVCHIATNVKQVTSVNDFAIFCQGDGIFSFGSIHPCFENYKAEIDRLSSAGIKGLKFHPDYQKYFVDDESVYPIYEYAAGKGLILLFHTGFDIGLRGVIKCTPDRLVNVADAFKGAKLVAAHMGGMYYEGLTEEYLIGKDIYFDTSAVMHLIPKEQSLRMIRSHGADKILFATDLPWFSPEDTIRHIESLGLTEDEKELIYHKNAEKLLGI